MPIPVSVTRLSELATPIRGGQAPFRVQEAWDYITDPERTEPDQFMRILADVRWVDARFDPRFMFDRSRALRAL
ncbi:MAG: hypothetical protein QGG40_16960, partial [Myxococcota bacterium]|nr:hypothetical protein [Myxococcota bacterium]